MTEGQLVAEFTEMHRSTLAVVVGVSKRMDTMDARLGRLESNVFELKSDMKIIKEAVLNGRALSE